MTVIHGDCLEVMAGMDPESVDAIVTDPPYGLGFMGKAWDSAAGPGDSPMRRRPELDAVNAGMSRQGGRQWRGTDGQKRQARDARAYQAWCEEWAAECLRVAKPSAYLLAFGGTRTVHRMTVALEDAGWVIRDMLVWAYASGFPKSKASLKPAWEPIVMARKPGPLRMLNIDGCRIGTTPGRPGNLEDRGRGDGINRLGGGDGASYTARLDAGEIAGRWPANVILTDPIFDGEGEYHRSDCRCPCHEDEYAEYAYGSREFGCRRCTDEAFYEAVVGGGETTSGAKPTGGQVRPDRADWRFDGGTGIGDSGTYSRFFLIPKAARTDREPVLGGLEPRFRGTRDGMQTPLTEQNGTAPRNGAIRQNVHPTVKPVDLMRHLVRLVTPTGGTVLDPFLGSGTTGLAAELEGFPWIGIEREAEYVAIAEARLNGTQRGLGLEAS